MPYYDYYSEYMISFDDNGHYQYDQEPIQQHQVDSNDNSNNHNTQAYSNNGNHYDQKTIDTHTAEQNTIQNVVNTPHVTCIGTCYIPNSQRVSSENNN